MVLRFVLIVLLSLAALPPHAHAQEASVEPLEITASGEAYLSTIRFRRINSDVAYFDPTQPPPELTTSQTPRERPDRDHENTSGSLQNGQIILLAITGTVMAVILYLFVKFGGAGSISFGQSPENAARDPKRRAAEAESLPNTPASLQAILRMADRREALVALSNYLLSRIVAAEGVLLQRSWTARDALRRVPRDFQHREALQSLVLASERVQFGGRDVSEDEFQDHLGKLKPLYTQGAA